jgi:hypothetical protein
MSEAPQAPRSRYESIELHLPEVEKFIAGLEAGVFEAYETLGMALGSIVDQPNQSDIFMPIISASCPNRRSAQCWPIRASRRAGRFCLCFSSSSHHGTANDTRLARHHYAQDRRWKA